MPRAYVPEEVEVLRFFEDAPIEKAELLFNIVKDKMRGRLANVARAGAGESRKKRHSPPKNVGEAGSGSDAGTPSAGT